MNSGKTLFAELIEFVPWTSFARIVTRYSGDVRVSALPSTEHFRIMACEQLTWRESLRDIEVIDKLRLTYWADRILRKVN